MAALYLGRRIDGDDRIFAVKVIHPHFLDDEDLVTMFLDEAGLSVRIQHPNVVYVEEVGEHRGMHYIAMEYIHGCSLAQLLQALIRLKRRMSPELAVYIAMNVAEGLHAAHELVGDHGEPLNVVHRDVSPQNVLLSHTGEIKLIDFGIAKSRMRVHHSQTGTSIRGKLRYMAPEHAKGQSVDRRTDVYALSIVLWEMLTMRPLFWANTDFGVLAKVREPVIEPPSRYAPRIAESLDEVLLTSLSPVKEDRPESARSFRRMLSQAVPFAEALDEDQVAELLHVILGEEMSRRIEELPHIASSDISVTTGRGSRPALPDRVLETLTDQGELDDALLEESLASFELVDESVSADPTPHVPAKAAEAALIASLQDFANDEVDDPTELMSRDAILEVHEALNRIRQQSFQRDMGAKKGAARTDPTEQNPIPRYESEPPTVADAQPYVAPAHQAHDLTVRDAPALRDDDLADEPSTLDEAPPGPRTPIHEVVLPERAPALPQPSRSATSSAPPRPRRVPEPSGPHLLVGGFAVQGSGEKVDTEVDLEGDADDEYEPPTDVYQPRFVPRDPREERDSYAGLVAAVAVVGLLLAALAGILLW